MSESLSKMKWVYNEILVRYNNEMIEPYKALNVNERIFVYYLYRAGLSGNLIFRDQQHRHTNDLIKLFKAIWENRGKISDENFLKDCETYLIYLLVNHGFYFCREHHDEKRTPKRLGLHHLTRENLNLIKEQLPLEINHSDGSFTMVNFSNEEFQSLVDSLFEETKELSCCLPKSIEGSGGNYYAPNFTKTDYDQLSTEQQSQINAYFDKDEKGQPFTTPWKYKAELDVAKHWLQQAHLWASQHPDDFDDNLVQSLDWLVKFYQSGNESDFREHCKVWLKSNSRIDYCHGFIETYHDPMSFRGMFQSDICVKTIDMTQFNQLIPKLEEKMPLPKKYKRDLTAKANLMNASMNQRLSATGHLGPASVTAAYCLPNYEDIREEVGSKQIIYNLGESVSELISKEKTLELMVLRDQLKWQKEHDPENQLSKDVWNLQCILHETLGHGSGRLDQHTFVEGEPLKDGEEIGQTVPVTTELYARMMTGIDHAIEEMRAEINALYVSVNNLDDLRQMKPLDRWQGLDFETLQDQLILGMAKTGLRRLLQQPESATTVSGDHALANNTITNYLVMNGGLEYVEETIELDGESYVIVGLRIKDRPRTFELIEELMVKVQTIKSTADGQQANELINRYGRPIHNPDHIKHQKRNLRVAVGNVKVVANIFPYLEPIISDNGQIVDVKMTWASNIIEEHQMKDYLAMSYE